MSKQKLEEIQTITIVVHFYPHTNLFSKIYAFWGLYSRCPSHIGVVLLLFIAVFNSPSLSPSSSSLFTSSSLLSTLKALHCQNPRRRFVEMLQASHLRPQKLIPSILQPPFRSFSLTDVLQIFWRRHI